MKLRIKENTYDLADYQRLGYAQSGEERVGIEMDVKHDDVIPTLSFFEYLPDSITVEMDDTFELIEELTGFTAIESYSYSFLDKKLLVILTETPLREQIKDWEEKYNELLAKSSVGQSGEDDSADGDRDDRSNESTE